MGVWVCGVEGMEELKYGGLCVWGWRYGGIEVWGSGCVGLKVWRN